MKQTREQIIQTMLDTRIVAIVRGMEPQYCVPLAKALYAGGIRLMEVTFDQTSSNHYQDTTDAISAISKEVPEMIVGAGTVLSEEQVDLARDAGGTFIVTPTTKPSLIQYAVQMGLVTMPGAMTPTEVVSAYEAGADFVKVFPAGEIGPGYIKALKAPLKHIPLLAVGGVNEKNVADYRKAGVVGVGVGGNLVNRQWIINGEYEKITALAKEFVKNVK